MRTIVHIVQIPNLPVCGTAFKKLAEPTQNAKPRLFCVWREEPPLPCVGVYEVVMHVGVRNLKGPQLPCVVETGLRVLAEKKSQKLFKISRRDWLAIVAVREAAARGADSSHQLDIDVKLAHLGIACVKPTAWERVTHRVVVIGGLIKPNRWYKHAMPRFDVRIRIAAIAVV